jgi:hypothetical protein
VPAPPAAPPSAPSPTSPGAAPVSEQEPSASPPTPSNAQSGGSASRRPASTSFTGPTAKRRAPLRTQTVYRFTNRGPDRNAVVLVFELQRPGRLVLVVRGPGPGCDVATRLSVTGKKGTNRFRFAGRPYGRPLPTGTYVLELRRRGAAVPLGEVAVEIVAPGTFASAATPAPRCGPNPALPPLRVTAATAPRAAHPPRRAEAPPAADVLGEVRSEQPGSRFAGGVAVPQYQADKSLLEVVLLAIVLASGLALAVGLLGTLRRGRTRD